MRTFSKNGDVIQTLSGLEYKEGYVNIGKNIIHLDWCPNMSTDNQILACLTKLEINDLSNKETFDLIQIWDYQSLKQTKSKPVLKYCLLHNWGTVTCMRWISPDNVDVSNYVKNNHKKNEIDTSQHLYGHLLFACTDGFIRIVPFPNFSTDQLKELYNDVFPILTIQPTNVMKLGISTSYLNDTLIRFGYPTCVDWRPKFSSKLLVGFSKGHVAIYDLSCVCLTRYDYEHNYLSPIFKQQLSPTPVISVSFSPIDWQQLNVTVQNENNTSNNFMFNMTTRHDPPIDVLLEKSASRKVIWPVRNDILLSLHQSKNKITIKSILTQGVAEIPMCGITSMTMCDLLNCVIVSTDSGTLMNISLNEQSVVESLTDCRDLVDPSDTTSVIRYYRYGNNDNQKVIDNKATLIDCISKENLLNIYDSFKNVIYPIITNIAVNPNISAYGWIAVGFDSGLVHLVRITNRQICVNDYIPTSVTPVTSTVKMKEKKNVRKTPSIVSPKSYKKSDYSKSRKRDPLDQIVFHESPDVTTVTSAQKKTSKPVSKSSPYMKKKPMICVSKPVVNKKRHSSTIDDSGEMFPTTSDSDRIGSKDVNEFSKRSRQSRRESSAIEPVEDDSYDSSATERMCDSRSDDDNTRLSAIGASNDSFADSILEKHEMLVETGENGQRHCSESSVNTKLDRWISATEPVQSINGDMGICEPQSTGTEIKNISEPIVGDSHPIISDHEFDPTRSNNDINSIKEPEENHVSESQAQDLFSYQNILDIATTDCNKVEIDRSGMEEESGAVAVQNGMLVGGQATLEPSASQSSVLCPEISLPVIGMDFNECSPSAEELHSVDEAGDDLLPPKLVSYSSDCDSEYFEEDIDRYSHGASGGTLLVEEENKSDKISVEQENSLKIALISDNEMATRSDGEVVESASIVTYNVVSEIKTETEIPEIMKLDQVKGFDEILIDTKGNLELTEIAEPSEIRQSEEMADNERNFEFLEKMDIHEDDNKMIDIRESIKTTEVLSALNLTVEANNLVEKDESILIDELSSNTSIIESSDDLKVEKIDTSLYKTVIFDKPMEINDLTVTKEPLETVEDLNESWETMKSQYDTEYHTLTETEKTLETKEIGESNNEVTKEVCRAHHNDENTFYKIEHSNKSIENIMLKEISIDKEASVMELEEIIGAMDEEIQTATGTLMCSDSVDANDIIKFEQVREESTEISEFNISEIDEIMESNQNAEINITTKSNENAEIDDNAEFNETGEISATMESNKDTEVDKTVQSNESAKMNVLKSNEGEDIDETVESVESTEINTITELNEYVELDKTVEFNDRSEINISMEGIALDKTIESNKVEMNVSMESNEGVKKGKGVEFNESAQVDNNETTETWSSNDVMDIANILKLLGESEVKTTVQSHDVKEKDIVMKCDETVETGQMRDASELIKPFNEITAVTGDIEMTESNESPELTEMIESKEPTDDNNSLNDEVVIEESTNSNEMMMVLESDKIIETTEIVKLIEFDKTAATEAGEYLNSPEVREKMISEEITEINSSPLEQRDLVKLQEVDTLINFSVNRGDNESPVMDRFIDPNEMVKVVEQCKELFTTEIDNDELEIAKSGEPAVFCEIVDSEKILSSREPMQHDETIVNMEFHEHFESNIITNQTTDINETEKEAFEELKLSKDTGKSLESCELISTDESIDVHKRIESNNMLELHENMPTFELVDNNNGMEYSDITVTNEMVVSKETVISNEKIAIGVSLEFLETSESTEGETAKINEEVEINKDIEESINVTLKGDVNEMSSIYESSKSQSENIEIVNDNKIVNENKNLYAHELMEFSEVEKIDKGVKFTKFINIEENVQCDNSAESSELIVVEKPMQSTEIIEDQHDEKIDEYTETSINMTPKGDVLSSNEMASICESSKPQLYIIPEGIEIVHVVDKEIVNENKNLDAPESMEFSEVEKIDKGVQEIVQSDIAAESSELIVAEKPIDIIEDQQDDIINEDTETSIDMTPKEDVLSANERKLNEDLEINKSIDEQSIKACETAKTIDQGQPIRILVDDSDLDVRYDDIDSLSEIKNEVNQGDSYNEHVQDKSVLESDPDELHHPKLRENVFQLFSNFQQVAEQPLSTNTATCVIKDIVSLATTSEIDPECELIASDVSHRNDQTDKDTEDNICFRDIQLNIENSTKLEQVDKIHIPNDNCNNRLLVLNTESDSDNFVMRMDDNQSLGHGNNKLQVPITMDNDNVVEKAEIGAIDMSSLIKSENVQSIISTTNLMTLKHVSDSGNDESNLAQEVRETINIIKDKSSSDDNLEPHFTIEACTGVTETQGVGVEVSSADSREVILDDKVDNTVEGTNVELKNITTEEAMETVSGADIEQKKSKTRGRPKLIDFTTNQIAVKSSHRLQAASQPPAPPIRNISAGPLHPKPVGTKPPISTNELLANPLKRKQLSCQNLFKSEEKKRPAKLLKSTVVGPTITTSSKQKTFDIINKTEFRVQIEDMNIKQTSETLDSSSSVHPTSTTMATVAPMAPIKKSTRQLVVAPEKFGIAPSTLTGRINIDRNLNMISQLRKRKIDNESGEDRKKKKIQEIATDAHKQSTKSSSAAVISDLKIHKRPGLKPQPIKLDKENLKQSVREKLRKPNNMSSSTITDMQTDRNISVTTQKPISIHSEKSISKTVSEGEHVKKPTRPIGKLQTINQYNSQLNKLNSKPVKDNTDIDQIVDNRNVLLPSQRKQPVAEPKIINSILRSDQIVIQLKDLKNDNLKIDVTDSEEKSTQKSSGAPVSATRSSARLSGKTSKSTDTAVSDNTTDNSVTTNEEVAKSQITRTSISGDITNTEDIKSANVKNTSVINDNNNSNTEHRRLSERLSKKSVCYSSTDYSAGPSTKRDQESKTSSNQGINMCSSILTKSSDCDSKPMKSATAHSSTSEETSSSNARPTKSTRVTRMSLGPKNWWDDHVIHIAWNTPGKYKGGIQIIRGHLLDEEPKIQAHVYVRWPKKNSTTKFPAIIKEIKEKKTLSKQ